MPDLRESCTLPVERNETWEAGPFATETAECAWATEAIFFVRALRVSGDLSNVAARVQISPDGMHWVDEGTTLYLPTGTEEVTFAKVSCFGGWLRMVGEIPGGASITLIVYLTLKG
jgi:hypothetical protein